MKNTMKAIHLFFLLTFLPSIGMGFSDGSGPAILAKVTTLVERTTAQLKAMKETLSINQYLEQIEFLNEAKSLVEGADQLQNLILEIEELYDVGQDIVSLRGMGVEELMADLKVIEAEFDRAGNLSGTEKVKGYIRTVQQLRRLEFLNLSHADNLKKVSEGLNSREASKSSAQSAAITADVLLRMEQRQLEEQAEKDVVMLQESQAKDALASGYRSIGKLKR